MTERSIFSFVKRHKARKSTPRIILKSGFMVIDEYGVARPDYSDPKLQQHLKRQIEEFAKIKVSA